MEPTMLLYWIDCLTKLRRNGLTCTKEKSFIILKMHHLTHLSLHRQKKHELGLELFSNPPYSPDLDPNLKRWLYFESNEDVKWETEAYFEVL